jgi:hypothetical protein
MKQRVYIDTSVIGGCFDSEFEEWSNKLFEDFKTGKKIAVLSDITLDELSDAPKWIQDNFRKIPEKNLEVLISDAETKKLAEQYIKEGAISSKF